MKTNNLLLCVILLLLLPCCRKEDRMVEEPPEGCIDLSDLETNHDYYLPFAILNDTSIICQAILNDELIDFPTGSSIEFNDNGFYELILKYISSLHENDTFLFTTITREREESEWGIRAWIPAPYEKVQLGSGEIEVIYPHRFAGDINVPFVFHVKESGTVMPVYCQGKGPAAADTFNIKRGTGSVNIAASAIAGTVNFNVGGKQVSVSPVKITGPAIELKGTISSSVEIPANSLVTITENLAISSTGSLTVHEGAVILVNEGVDINVSGPVIFSGSAVNPVFITCSMNDSYWGGFITRVPEGTVDAVYTIFCRSGYHDSEGYNWGHSGRQALFYTENSTLKLDHCFITDHIGQIFYPQYATINLSNILVQRAQTGGQINYSDLVIRNSVFTDFPDDSPVFQDSDNDALYLSASDAEIENTSFMFAKDDGLDSGNEEGGEITFTNCRFEACFHEGAALSSGGTVIKNHTFTGCVFTNCGQGLELGFSSPNHTVVAEDCMFLNNGIGIRYGDNYEWSEIEGKMFVRNSSSLYNDRDVWNMVRMTWSPRLENLSFTNTIVSRFSPQYPGLLIQE